MKLFLDTSSLFKLYHQESGTEELEKLFQNIFISHLYLSELTKLEFISTLWKNVRIKNITKDQAENTLKLFESDFEKYCFVSVDISIIENAKNLPNKYGTEGLRTLDSIQLSTSIFLANEADIFLTSDNLLESFMIKEGLNTTIPLN